MIRASAPTLAVGAAGSALAMWAGVPLAPLVGAMFAILILGQAGGAAFVAPPLRRVAYVVIGAAMGGRFPADLAERAQDWPYTLAAIPVFILAALGLATFYLVVAARYDRATAMFSAMPGGLLVMVALGEQAGARTPTILLGHTVRVILAVTTIPMTLLEFGASTTGPAGVPGTVSELAITFAAAAAGSVAGRWIRLPAADVLGPMMAVAALHTTGLVEGTTPGLLMAAGLSVSGAALGAQVRGLEWRGATAVLAHTCVIYAMFIALAVGVAAALHPVTGIEAEAIFLAFAPGGLTEMAAVAFAAHHDPAFVALHHAVRVLLCSLIGTGIAAWIQRADQNGHARKQRGS